MIKKPTVLILGAGASAPYGYPTGLALKQETIKGLSPGGSAERMRQIVSMTGDIYQVKLKEFVFALRTSGQASIDAFLEHRPEFMELGKSAITQILTSRENLTDMFEVED
jgi:hypothetical protein